MQQIQEHALGLRTAAIDGVYRGGRPKVRCEGESESRVASAVWMQRTPDWRQCQGVRVLVGFCGDLREPVIVGLIDPPPAAALVATADVQRPALVVSHDRELVLQCGKSKIALRADGRIEILGGYLLSRSTGPNKIKGASVDIN
jgi:hypothetical protein